jgi:carbamoyl-phosphate synthase large subunit
MSLWKRTDCSNRVSKGTSRSKRRYFPFNKLYGADLVLSPEMKSTGEVMGISQNFGVSFAKSQLAAGNKIPTSGTCFLSFIEMDKAHAAEIARGLHNKGSNWLQPVEPKK